MKKYIKFIMSSGDGISVPLEQAQKILSSQVQLVQISGDDGLWTGQTVNTAHIVLTDRDRQREKMEAEQERMKTPRLNEPKPTPEQIKKAEAIKKKIRDKFRIKK